MSDTRVSIVPDPALGPIRTIADLERIERTPIEDRLAHDNTYDLLAAACGIHKANCAIRFLPNGVSDDLPIDYSFSALLANVRRTANLLHAHNIRPGKAFGMLLPNLPETEFFLWGGEAAGIACPINFYLEPEHIAGILKVAGVEVLVAQGPSTVPIWEKVHRIRELCPAIKTVIRVGPGPDGPDIVDYHRALDNYPAERLISRRRFSRDDVAAYFHTGGTTGVPKITPLSHWNEVCCVWTHQLMFGFNAADACLCGMPLFHAGGIKLGGIVPLTAGARVVLLGPYGFRSSAVIKSFWRTLSAEHATYVAGSPTVYASLAEVAVDADISTLEMAQVSGAPCPGELFRRFKERTGHDLCEAYGVTESTLATTGYSRGSPGIKFGSAGIRIPYIQQKVVKLDGNGRYLSDCGLDEIGNIVVKSPTNFSGYLGDRETASSFIVGGWFNTGDLGRQDEDGHFWITGRAKDVIIRGGHNIDPEAIEEPLYRHPAIALCAAIGRPDAYAGEVPIAYVTLKRGCSAKPEELLVYARSAIGERAAVPKEIIVVDQLPLTAIGKIHKPALRIAATADALRTALQPIESRGIPLNVEVRSDSRHGLLARVNFGVDDDGQRASLEAEALALMSPFAIKCELT